MSKTAYLIDGMAYVFRAFYGLHSMKAPDGTPINAVFGLGMTLQKLLNEHLPELVVCCFDAGSQTFRNDIFPAYKANRAAPPEDLVPQFDLCRELVECMGITTMTCPGYEADDVMATLANRLQGEGHEVVIVTGDKDMAQVVGPQVRIFNLAKDDWWTVENVPDRWGVRVEQVRDFLALKGDSADNIPGVLGVGDKAATALLAEFDDLEAIYADLGRVETLSVRGAKSLRRKLESGRKNAHLSRQLVELDRKVPCDLSTAAMSYLGADSNLMDAFAEKWGLGRVASKVPRR